MKERPILFSAPMVRAILDGRKMQTRRIVKPQPTGSSTWLPYSNGFDVSFYPNNVKAFPARLVCPYGTAGSRLWVREATAYAEADNGSEMLVYGADLAVAGVYQLGDGPKSLNGFLEDKWIPERNGTLKFKPSIHMPRWASRITLEITGVRVERLWDISHADALAEGVEYDVSKDGGSPVACFTALWRSINGPESWNENPWVWVVEFKRNDDAIARKEQRKSRMTKIAEKKRATSPKQS